MAIQKGTVLVRGKLGNIVGMKNGFGTKKEAFARQYVAEVTNPQTDSQMNQRVKMLPAVLFRRQLAEVISRAWEGKKYGGQSIREFMKYALKEPWANVPQLVKDSAIAIPGAYLISKGSLPTIGVSIANGAVSIALPTGDEYDGDATIGEVSEALLANNAFLRNGDQLTLIVAYSPSSTINYVIYQVASFYINAADDTTLSAWAGNDIGIATDSNGEKFEVRAIQGAAVILGASIVLSREGANANQRSTQRFVLNTTALTSYFDTTLKDAIAASYVNTKSAKGSRDWPYEEGVTEDVPTEDNPTVQRVAINVSASPSEGGTVSGGGNKTVGSTCTLQATPASGYTFNGWVENGSVISSANPYSFTVEQARTLYASFNDGNDPGEDRP